MLTLSSSFASEINPLEKQTTLDCKIYFFVSRIFLHFAQMAPSHGREAILQALTFIGQGGRILMAFDHYEGIYFFVGKYIFCQKSIY